VGAHTFERFLCLNGPAFYGFPGSSERFALEKTPATTPILETPAGPVTPLPAGMNLES
jgi:dihydroorotase